MRRLRIAALTALVAGLLTAAWLTINRIPNSFSASKASQSTSSTPESLAVLAAKVQLQPRGRLASRPVYQYSVLRGGVRSPQELREAMAHDSELADHYAGFRFERARLARLQHAQLMYISYRKNGRIYWTRTAHLIPAGETVITDGEITGRTRCANRLSVRKQLGVSPDEPPQVAMEQVEPPPMLPPASVNFPTLYHSAVLTGPDQGSPWVGPRFGDPLMFFPPPVPLAFGGGGVVGCRPAVKKAADDKDNDTDVKNDGDADDRNCRPVKPPPPSTVPEPSTWLLLGTGALAMLLLLKVRRPTTTS